MSVSPLSFSFPFRVPTRLKFQVGQFIVCLPAAIAVLVATVLPPLFFMSVLI